MSYLLDTNIFLEIFLGQENSNLSKSIINKLNQDIIISDFSLHSIGVILSRKSLQNVFTLFIKELLESNKFKILTISINDMIKITDNINHYKLDFDDAYQLTLANIYDLTIITYDKDFIKEGVKSMTPSELLYIL